MKHADVPNEDEAQSWVTLRSVAIHKVFCGTQFEAHEAIQYLASKPSPDEVPLFMAIFARRRGLFVRVEVADALGRIGTKEARNQLLKISRGPYISLVKYYAIRNLIELGDDRWHQNIRSPRRQSAFWNSLKLYEQYRKSEITREVMISTAAAQTTHPGDDWAWLTHM